MLYDISLKNTIEQSFTQYSGAVIQSRALVDVRDCVKPSARQIYYSLFTDGFTHNKPFKKTLKAIGSCMRFYIHGDSSCEGVIMRSGQPFAFRYPLVEVEGSYGNLTETGNWAASRYTASRLSELTNYLIQDTNNHTINEWIDNYDDTEQYPRILSSLGFYNIVNGTTGIAVGTASSIPQFNLFEVNEAIKKLINNPDTDFDEIFCYPDFATGGTIINKNEVKESIRKGKGDACILRAKIAYNNKDNALIVSEMPYGVYTNTVCSEIEKMVSNNEDVGIININDLTGEQVNIKIYLAKEYKNNSEKIEHLIEELYNKTSLQKSFSINMTMLEDGRYPKVFGWKEALIAHIDHERETYIRLFSYQKEKLLARLSIVIGILAAIDNINEVIKVIRQASSTEEAKTNLIQLLNINQNQAKAILDIKLVRLAKLESNKFLQEKNDLETEISRLTDILSSNELLNQEMIKKIDEVSNKFKDERRTEVVQKEIKKSAKYKKKEFISEPVVIVYTEKGYIKSIPTKIYKSYKDNILVGKTDTSAMIYLISTLGKLYRINAKKIKQCDYSDKGTALGSILSMENEEKIIYGFIKSEDNPYLIMATRNGLVKKIENKEYYGSTQNLRGTKAMNLKNNDKIVSVAETTKESYVTLNSKDGYTIYFVDTDLSFQGKTAGGVKGINLNDGDEIISATISSIKNTKLTLQKRGGKGKKIK